MAQPRRDMETAAGSEPSAEAHSCQTPRFSTTTGVVPRTILVEGHNLTLEAGTGIATYTRVLAGTARSLGYRVEALIGARHGIDAKDPLLNEVNAFDAERPPTLGQYLRRQYRIAIGMPFGARAYALPQAGAVVGPAYERLAAFDAVHAAAQLFNNAEFHFRRYGRRLPVRVSSSPALFHATHPTPIAVSGCPNIYTIHDLVPLRVPYTTLEDKKYWLHMVRAICRSADHIVTVSEASRRDIIKLIGIEEDRITNLYQSVHIPDAMLASPIAEVDQELERLFDLRCQEYFLFVGAIEPKKNLARLIDAYASSGSKWPLVIAGGLGWQYKEDLEKIEDDRFAGYSIKDGIAYPRRRIRRLSYLPFAQLITLLRGARAVLFPSIYEGFGLPVLEAMLAGAPVMTSKIASLPEVAGDAALLVNPFDVGEMAQAIKRLDQDGDLRTELSAKGRERARFFAPERYQKRLGEFYEHLLGRTADGARGLL